jgi:hypothetical protein
MQNDAAGWRAEGRAQPRALRIVPRERALCACACPRAAALTWKRNAFGSSISAERTQIALSSTKWRQPLAAAARTQLMVAW